ncbi:MAG: AAA family ATPase [Proteobacteria bacterium]|nr:AAA family ATPase [Pseudomonadota bacterium]
MKNLVPLTPLQLRPGCDPQLLNFTTTAQITDFVEYIGQTRALEALAFGINMRTKSYHLFASAPSGLGKHYFIRHYLDKVAFKEPAPSDWCYVNNFKDPQLPIALEFPPGEGDVFKQNMKNFIEQLQSAIPAMFASKEYRTIIEKIELKYKNKEERLMKKIENDAKATDLTIIRYSGGYEVIPLVNNEKMTKEQIDKLDEKDKKELNIKINKIMNRLEKIKDEMPQWYKEKHIRLKDVKHNFAHSLVASMIGKLKEQHSSPKVLNYLRAVQEDIIESPELFTKEVSKNGSEKSELWRYEVNVIIKSDKDGHAPVVFERNPNYANLIGQLEGSTQHGNIISDFTLIKPGALHKANGGYLMLDMRNLNKDPHAWESLKRILLAQKINIEPIHSQSNIGSSQLHPEPIPMTAKVVLLGNRYLYDDLGEDTDFIKLFHVFVDFETTLERTEEHIQQFTSYVARMIKKRKLGAFHRDAMTCIIEHCIRLTGDSRKISLQRSSLVEIIEEARYWANKHTREVVYKEDVQKAIEAKIKRIDKIRKEYYEDIFSKNILIDIEGEVVGQVNGLSVIEVPNFAFGLPTRITATTRSGKESMVDIQREVNLGGSIHSKGVLILSGFLKGRYAKDVPLFLSASLVMEQTYGLVEGDSASLAEVCALISSLANIPIFQHFAVTGSMNQHGFVQAIGGANEKIEGFFDICSHFGLTGKQGVIIPQANVKNLMLKQEVVDACDKGLFHVYAINTIDEALFLLTGIAPDEIQHLCETTLKHYATLRKGFFE